MQGITSRPQFRTLQEFRTLQAVISIAVVAVTLLLFSDSAWGGMNPAPRLAIDVRPVTGRTCAALQDGYPSCDAISISMPMLGEFEAVIVLYNFDNVTGIEYGLAWPADWDMVDFLSCSDMTLGGDLTATPMWAGHAWGWPVVAHDGEGIPVAFLRGNATSPGCLSIVPELRVAGNPVVADSLFHADPVIAWSDACVGTTIPDDPCAFGAETPVAKFEASPTSGDLPLEVTFTDQSTGEPNSWFWDFGDGDTSWAQNPTAVFDSCGDYTVSLQVANEAAVDDTFRLRLVEVRGGMTAAFSLSPSTGCLPLEVHFIDESDTRADDWIWFIEGGIVLRAQNPVYVFTRGGSFDVTLKVYSPCGTAMTTRVDAIIAQDPPTILSADVDPARGCAPLAARFSSVVDPSVTRWLWDFGDGTTSTDPSPEHEFIGRRPYTVSCTVWNVCDSATVTLVDGVRGDLPPRLWFDTYLPPCVIDPVLFRNYTAGTVDGWWWDFGDGTTSTDREPAHHYSHVGTYGVKLTAFTACGIDSTIRMIYVDEDCGTGATQLQGPEAEVQEGGVLLRWVVIPPTSYAGYNVHRAQDPGGVFARVNDALLPDLTGIGIRTHEFLDQTVSAGATYYYRLEAVSRDGWSTTFALPYSVTFAAGEFIRTAWLGTPRPVPFRGRVEVELGVPMGGPEIDFAVYDARGRRLRTLARGVLPGGRYLMEWDARDDAGALVAPGVYFFRLEMADRSWTRKLLLMQ